MKSHISKLLHRAALIATALLAAAPLCDAATIPSKGGIVVFTSNEGDSDKFAVANEFVSVETFGMTSTFKFANGQSRQMQPPNLRAVVPYPDYAALTLVTEADWDALEKIAQDADAAAQKYPKSATLMQGLKATLTTALQKHQQGYVVINGGWLSKEDYAKKVTDTKADYVAQMVLSGKMYKNVRLSAVNGDLVKLMHDGGFANVPLADLQKLPDETRKPLAKTNPRLASILGYKAADLGSSAGSVAAANVASAGTYSTFSYTIAGEQVTITRVGTTETYAIDKVPAGYLSNNPELAQAVKDHLAKKNAK
ncbi:hypothetical protein DES53_101132 [Roseimicrobium gellanilyticum]|uniref:Uncharacterized protein n=1 Tax=Roseimicrobium gellanilyticum TaxID=748857 RepID=A0A366HV13_9BACT|nr:hypothetical protein [Roseimicrobium gellanilyticum]RBP47335.1 hypothetical protein DES53_101132 [Roseimicrobium gellanilyticum]